MNRVYLILFIAVLAFIIFLHFHFLMPGYDAGIHMYGARLVTKGLSPYIDMWNNKPPLIYVFGAPGFLWPSNPFIGVRVLELLVFFLDLVLLWKITRLWNAERPVTWLPGFCVIYLLCWDRGFLTETFHIPLMLLAVYLLLKKIKYYEWIGALLVVLSFLLKQNAGIITAIVMLADVCTRYRPGSPMRKILHYSIATLVYAVLVFALLKLTGNWNDFVDQVFTYNSQYVKHPSLIDQFTDHFLHSSFISIKGISVVMIFNLCVVIMLVKYWRLHKNKHLFSLEERVLAASAIVYLLAYYFAYISGKTYPHYYMLLIVPASLIFGHFVSNSIAGKIAFVLLLAFAVYANQPNDKFYKERQQQSKEVVAFIKTNTNPGDHIHIDGRGDQHIYIMADRLSNTKFISPLMENDGYSEHYRQIITNDFSNNPPALIVMNKVNNKRIDTANFYFQVLQQTLTRYHSAFENKLYHVYLLDHR